MKTYCTYCQKDVTLTVTEVKNLDTHVNVLMVCPKGHSHIWPMKREVWENNKKKFEV